MVIKKPVSPTYGECVKESNYLLITLISCCWSVTACSKLFFFLLFPAARPVIDHLPWCQIWCQNMIMRLHTFSGDSRGKTRAVETDETNLQSWNHQSLSAVRSARLQGADSREAKEPAQDARTFTHIHIGSNNKRGSYVLVEFDLIIHWWVEAFILSVVFFILMSIK